MSEQEDYEPSVTEQIEAIEFQKARAKEQIEFSERVERLLKNPDFRAIILEHYCVKEAANLVHQSADPILRPDQRADSLAMAQATGHLKRWLQVQNTIKMQLVERMPEMEEQLEELRSMQGQE